MCKAQQLNQKKENEYSEHQLNRVEVLECKWKYCHTKLRLEKANNPEMPSC
jgi:hypothetical protein